MVDKRANVRKNSHTIYQGMLEYLGWSYIKRILSFNDWLIYQIELYYWRSSDLQNRKFTSPVFRMFNLSHYIRRFERSGNNICYSI